MERRRRIGEEEENWRGGGELERRRRIGEEEENWRGGGEKENKRSKLGLGEEGEERGDGEWGRRAQKCNCC